jgi:TetR/AcrR family transcriptional regulator, transcriptional repressor for nem operon
MNNIKLYQPVGLKRVVALSQKRQEIIESAALLMQSKGYEGTKLSDILETGRIGKGQFYYYFSSKRELGLAVIDYFFSSFNQELLENILSSQKRPEIRLNEMLEWVIEHHKSKQAKCGCVFGNFTLEMSEHDEAFRKKVSEVFEAWKEKLKPVLEEIIQSSTPIEPFETDKLAQGIVAMLEGGILIMKSKQDIQVLKSITDLVKDLVNSFRQSHDMIGID